MKWQPSDCKPGDMIRVKLGSIYHYGVFVSDDEVIQFGMPPLPQYKTDGDIVVLKSDIDAFSCGNIVEVAALDRKEKKRRIPPKKTVENARERLGGGGYDLLHNNCEHFAYECVFGCKYSEQEDAARRRWLNRSVFSVFVSDIPSDVRVEKVFSDKRNEDIAACRNESLKKARYTDWKLLEYAAKRVFGTEPDALTFEKRRNGKWVCKEFFFSLSHTDKTVAVAVSNAPCGVDIENISRGARYDEKTLARMRKHAFTKEEKELSKNSSLEFLKIWTAKESIFKAGDGKIFLPEKTAVSAKKTVTSVFEEKDLVLSCCGENADSARIVFVEPKDGSFSEISAEKRT